MADTGVTEAVQGVAGMASANSDAIADLSGAATPTLTQG